VQFGIAARRVRWSVRRSAARCCLGGGTVTRVDAMSFDIVVNKHAQRIYDEDDDVWPSVKRSGDASSPRGLTNRLLDHRCEVDGQVHAARLSAPRCLTLKY